MSQNTEISESLNTSDLSSTSEDDNELLGNDESLDENKSHVYEFKLHNGDTKICGLNKPQQNHSDKLRQTIKNPYPKDKIYTKTDLENMLQNIDIVENNNKKYDAYTARHTKLNDACDIIVNEKSRYDLNNIDSIKSCKFIEVLDGDIKCINNENELSKNNKKLLDINRTKLCKDIKHNHLVKIAKLFNLPYKGSKKQICKNLENYYNIDFKTSKNDEPFCYKHVKKECKTACSWYIESKFMLIERLKLLDSLSNNQNAGYCEVNGKLLEYSDKKCTTSHLLIKLRNTYNMKHLTSRCVKKEDENDSDYFEINMYELLIFRNIFKYYLLNSNKFTLDDSEDNKLQELKENLTNIDDSEDKLLTNTDEFYEYKNLELLLLKILKTDSSNTNNIIKSLFDENITKNLEKSKDKISYYKGIFQVLDSFNISNINIIKKEISLEYDLTDFTDILNKNESESTKEPESPQTSDESESTEEPESPQTSDESESSELPELPETSDVSESSNTSLLNENFESTDLSNTSELTESLDNNPVSPIKEEDDDVEEFINYMDLQRNNNDINTLII